jgi:hypothetical protein
VDVDVSLGLFRVCAPRIDMYSPFHSGQPATGEPLGSLDNRTIIRMCDGCLTTKPTLPTVQAPFAK